MKTKRFEDQGARGLYYTLLAAPPAVLNYFQQIVVFRATRLESPNLANSLFDGLAIGLACCVIASMLGANLRRTSLLLTAGAWLSLAIQWVRAPASVFLGGPSIYAPWLLLASLNWVLAVAGALVIAHVVARPTPSSAPHRPSSVTTEAPD